MRRRVRCCVLIICILSVCGGDDDDDDDGEVGFRLLADTRRRFSHLRASSHGHWPYEDPNELGAWHYVGRHARWHDGIKAMAEEVVRITLGVKGTGKLPPFITVHIRRTDFLSGCPQSKLPDECLAVREFANEVGNIKRTIGLKDIQVIVATDETDIKYLGELDVLGWYMVDYDTLTIEQDFGGWCVGQTTGTSKCYMNSYRSPYQVLHHHRQRRTLYGIRIRRFEGQHDEFACKAACGRLERWTHGNDPALTPGGRL